MPGEGCLLAMPMIIINMGGEMVYVLEQRLQAQQIAEEKGKKVLTDVLKTMYAPKFVAELFKPQPVYSTASTRQVFNRLAHSSIMRLNQNSMDKLFDLMTMGFKFQLLSCNSPAQLLEVTLNHLESLQRIAGPGPVRDLIEDARQRAIGTYSSLPEGELRSLKQTLCRYFQDRRVKVSLFLQDGTQNLDGTIVLDVSGKLPVGTDAPGVVTYYDSEGRYMSSSKLPELVQTVQPAIVEDVINTSSRDCTLGCNLYSKDRSSSAPAAPKSGADAAYVPPPAMAVPSTASTPASPAPAAASTSTPSRSESKTSAVDELRLLSALVGTDEKDVGTFKLNLFHDDNSSTYEPGTAVITIDGKDRAIVKDMMSRYSVEDNSSAGGKTAEPDDDLLTLLDSAN